MDAVRMSVCTPTLVLERLVPPAGHLDQSRPARTDLHSAHIPTTRVAACSNRRRPVDKPRTSPTRSDDAWSLAMTTVSPKPDPAQEPPPRSPSRPDPADLDGKARHNSGSFGFGVRRHVAACTRDPPNAASCVSRPGFRPANGVSARDRGRRAIGARPHLWPTRRWGQRVRVVARHSRRSPRRRPVAVRTA
jgi:hypothetical protein